MKSAAKNKDSDKLSQYVDYPTLRESFKANVSAYMANEMTKSQNGFEAFGMALGMAMVNQMVDAYITPENLAMLIQGQNAQIGGSTAPSEGNTSSKTNTDISMSYEGLNQFVVKFKTKDSSNEEVKLIFKRYGIISWKLAALRLPFPASQNTNLSSQNSKTPQPKKDNTTWLIPFLSNKVFQASNPENGIYQDNIYFDITLDTSHLKKPTRAVKGYIIFSDLFGAEKFRLNWTINQPLTPGTNYTENSIGFNYNQFEDSNIWMRNTELKDMTFQFEVSNILYQDGTRENL